MNHVHEITHWEPFDLTRRLFGWPALVSEPFPIVLTEGMDIYETDREITVRAPVPGIPPEEVNVTFENGVLRIQASHEETEKEKTAKRVVYRQQRATSFDYSTTLPRAVEADKILAEVKDGVVTVTAPIAEGARPKKVTVKVVK